MIRKPYAPMVEAIIKTSQTVKKPTAKAVITRITKLLHAEIVARANAEVPHFFKAHSDNQNVIDQIKALLQTKKMAGNVTEIRSWNDAWPWLLDASKVISGNREQPRGVDEVFACVFHYVKDNWFDYDSIAISLGYDSTEQANAEVKTHN